MLTIAVGLPVRTDGHRVAQDRLLTAVERALEARRSRLALSGSVIDPLRLTLLFLVAAVTLAAMGCVQIDSLSRSAVAMTLLATAMGLALTGGDRASGSAPPRRRSSRWRCTGA